MARTPKNNAASTPADKKADVEVMADVDNTTPADKKADKKEKVINDDDVVEIICLELAGKSVIGLDPKNPIKFDEKGKGKTTGKEAKRLITIPGYTLA